ncbi:MAG: preprotein translocase subunit SecE [Candidatus Coproplasma sp.]
MAKETEKKPSRLVRMGRKIKEVFSELKRVTWPSFGKVVKATGVVLVVVLIFTVIVTGINFGLQALLELLTKAGGV